jgi:hypothetical protein
LLHKVKNNAVAWFLIYFAVYFNWQTNRKPGIKFNNNIIEKITIYIELIATYILIAVKDLAASINHCWF